MTTGTAPGRSSESRRSRPLSYRQELSHLVPTPEQSFVGQGLAIGTARPRGTRRPERLPHLK